VTARFNELEQPPLDVRSDVSSTEWARLYDIAEEYIGTKSDQFDESIRHHLVLETLKQQGGREFIPIPLACTRRTETFVEWNSAHTMLNLEDNGRFTLFSNTLCKKLIREEGVDSDATVVRAHLHNVKDRRDFTVDAQVFIIAAGVIGNPQVCQSTL
jgi:pyranose oxidase